MARRRSISAVVIAAMIGSFAIVAHADGPDAGAAPSAAIAPSASASVAQAEESASPAALMFGKKCAGCHTLGDGDKSGPDLLGVTKRRDRKWLTSFVRNPSAMIDSGDAVANELLGKFKGMKMPEQPLTDEELDALFAYLDECAVKGGCKIATGKVKKASEATQAEIDEGRKLFEGVVPLANGGPACVSCHSAGDVGLLGGGTLAKDLTLVYARLGDNGLSSALATTPFPLMKDLYAKKPLRDGEAFRIKAFLYSTHLNGTEAAPDHNFFYVGFLGLCGSLGLMGAVWSGRMRGGVRQRVVHKRRNGKQRGEP